MNINDFVKNLPLHNTSLHSHIVFISVREPVPFFTVSWLPTLDSGSPSSLIPRAVLLDFYRLRLTPDRFKGSCSSGSPSPVLMRFIFKQKSYVTFNNLQGQTLFNEKFVSSNVSIQINFYR